MSYNFEHIPCLIWGCGDDRYGDFDAKNKAIKIMSAESHIFIDDYIIRTCTSIDLNQDTSDTDMLYKFGYSAHSVPSDIAIQILKDFNMGFFDGFMIRDISKLDSESYAKHRIQNTKFGTRIVLDLNGYGPGQRTDHCYD